MKKICERELNVIFLNRMLSRWRKQDYVQRFYCETNIFLNQINIFYCMEIAEYIHEVVVEPSYKKPTREYANPSGHSRKMR